MTRTLTLLLVCLSVLVWSCQSASSEQATQTKTVPSTADPIPSLPAEPEKPKLPNFQVTDLNGKNFTTADLPKDKPTVVVIFHPDCEHCQAEATELKDHQEELKKANFLMLTWDAIPKIKGFMDKYQLKDPIIAAQINPMTLAQVYGELSLPTIFIYNAKQELVQQVNGEGKVDAILMYLK